MIQKKYRSSLIALNNPLPAIYTLEFKSLAGKFRYHPGQYLHLTIDDAYDGIGQWPESRCFSMQSNPGEETIRITYAVKGRFTRMMEQQLRVGSEVWLKLPYGDLFTREHNKTNTVFIAGGTGITPFLSLFTHTSFNEYVHPRIYLGFRSSAYNIYGNDLNFVQLCENFEKLCAPKIYYEDIDGPIDIHHIFSENGSKPAYFISGPPEMIRSFKNHLIHMNVSVDQIISDDWE